MPLVQLVLEVQQDLQVHQVHEVKGEKQVYLVIQEAVDNQDHLAHLDLVAPVGQVGHLV